MNRSLRMFLVGIAIGVLLGWLLRDRDELQKRRAQDEAFESDPELIALRKERALDRQLEDALRDLEDDYGP